MSIEFTATARRLGVYSSAATAVLLAAYAVTLAVGLVSLESPDHPISDPMFSILEVLIIVMMPAMVVMMAAVHAWTPRQLKALSLVSVIFMGLLAGLTCSLHFVVLTLSRHPVFTEQPWLPLVMSFRWPSIVYSLDILGWDIFFAFSMLFAAPVFSGNRLAAWVRVAMITSGMLSLAGLIGVAAGDMQVRNIGILGYVGAFLITCILLAILFHRTVPAVSQDNGRIS